MLFLFSAANTTFVACVFVIFIFFPLDIKMTMKVTGVWMQPRFGTGSLDGDK